MSNYADKWTDAELKKLERKIAKVYSDAQKDLEKTAKDYFKQFEKRDAEQKKNVENGIITEKQHKDWRLAQISRGKRFEKMSRDMAERATKANEVAIAYVNDATPGIYTLNRNHEAYRIEMLGYEMVGANVGGVDFTLYNEQAVRRLVVENPKIMPCYPKAKAVDRGIDLAYGQSVIKRNVTSGILQGKSVYKLADDLQRDLTNMERSSAIRAARTATTSAQNGGRQASMEAAVAMGIDIRRQWHAVFDGKTRSAHGHADGQITDVDKPFTVGGEKLMFPGDPNGSPANVYNCRCRVESARKKGQKEKHQRRIVDPKFEEARNAELKAEKQLENLKDREKAETDPEKKKQIRQKRLVKQHELDDLAAKRRGIEKYKIVDSDFTYNDWLKLKGGLKNG